MKRQHTPIHSMTRRAPVTQKQIADELGVSRQLVSLALNNTGRISAENRRRVQEAAERLGYDEHSNREARAMIARRYSKRAQTGLLGCVYISETEDASVPGSSPLPYEAHLLQGIRQEAQRHDRNVLLLHPSPSNGWERVDGLLVHGKSPKLVCDRLGIAIPTVSMMSEVEGISSVRADDARGAYAATEHLIELGHRRIAYLLHPEGTPAVQERLRGYREALLAHGIEPQESWVGLLVNLGPMLERGRYSMERWLENGWAELGCTALMVQNDRAAVGAMISLRKAGIRMPQDLSVVGFDGTDECEIAVPRLTSVHVPLEEIGARAAQLLLLQIESEETGVAVVPQTIVLPTRLEIRDSTALLGVGSGTRQ